MPVIGQGTWNLDRAATPAQEIDALRDGIELGLTLIDTAEMYGDGGAEELVADAIDGRRDEVFLVSKVLPTTRAATGEGRLRASLARLAPTGSTSTCSTGAGVTRWPRRSRPSQSSEPRRARSATGASATSTSAISSARRAGGRRSAGEADQVLYNLSRRPAETRVLPWCRKRSMPIMAYSPLDHGRLLGPAAQGSGAPRDRPSVPRQSRGDSAGVGACASRGMRDPRATVEHVRRNRAALDLRLREIDMIKLEEASRRRSRRSRSTCARRSRRR